MSAIKIEQVECLACGVKFTPSIYQKKYCSRGCSGAALAPPLRVKYQPAVPYFEQSYPYSNAQFMQGHPDGRYGKIKLKGQIEKAENSKQRNRRLRRGRRAAARM